MRKIYCQVRYWDQKDHPITRFYNYLVSKGAWSEGQEKEWKNESKKKVKLESGASRNVQSVSTERTHSHSLFS